MHVGIVGVFRPHLPLERLYRGKWVHLDVVLLHGLLAHVFRMCVCARASLRVCARVCDGHWQMDAGCVVGGGQRTQPCPLPSTGALRWDVVIVGCLGATHGDVAIHLV